MPDYKYLLIGGGMTGDSAARGIRQVDPQGMIGLIGNELFSPYLRPPLTKGLWKGKPLDKIWRGTEKFNVDLRLGREARRIDPANHLVFDDTGERYHYEKLLLATGGTPRRLPFGGDHILYYRTLDDYQALREIANEGGTAAVIGGGFIGSEISAALTMNRMKTVMVFPEEGIGALVFPRELSQYVTAYYRQKGVEVITGAEVSGLERGENEFILQLRGRGNIQADVIVAGLGIQPNTGLAEAAGIEVDNGIVVNDFLETSQPDIYAAGDVASFFNPALGKRLRVEHEDNANTMGETAGKNMAGERAPYHHLPFFYSDLFELGYEAVGEFDPGLETFADWQEQFQKGVVYYLREGRVRGVLLWNVWGKVDAARELIARPGSLSKEQLKDRITD